MLTSIIEFIVYFIRAIRDALSKLISLHLPDYLLSFCKFYFGRSYLYCYLNNSTSTPKPTPLRFSSGCRTMDYDVLPLPFWQAAPSAHPPHLTRGWHCPSFLVLAAWYYIPQNQSGCKDLTQILHYMETPIKHPQNWNYFIFLAPSLHPRPYTKRVHLCALGLGRPLSRPCARFKTSLHPAPAHRSQ